MDTFSGPWACALSCTEFPGKLCHFCLDDSRLEVSPVPYWVRARVREWDKEKSF
jgi:hypothetical protein